jgi:hypothetical protein
MILFVVSSWPVMGRVLLPFILMDALPKVCIRYPKNVLSYLHFSLLKEKIYKMCYNLEDCAYIKLQTMKEFNFKYKFMCKY